MNASKKLRIGFLINALIITTLLVAPIPFFTRIIKELPLISLLLAELSLVFLVILASFPKAGIKDIVRLGGQYLGFIAICFSLLALLPLDDKFKILSIGLNSTTESLMPNSITVNIIAMVLLNTIAFLFFGTELNRKENTRRFRNKEEREKDSLENIDSEKLEKSFSNELKQEVDSLFDIYLNDFERGQIETNSRLENIENVLLDNIDLDISGAMCIDKEGKVLHDSVFHWEGYNKDDILEVFQNNNASSKDIGTGALCQMMLRDNKYWYMVAKYRGNFLLLQSESIEPSSLMETSYRVIKSLRLVNN